MANTDVKIVREELGQCRLRLNLEIPAAEVAKVLQATTNKVVREARIPGFRRGKVPLAVINRKFGQQIKDEAMHELLNTSVRQAMEQEKLELATPLDIENEDKLTLDEGQPLAFSLTCELIPKFELPNYKGLEAQLADVPVSDEQVDSVIRDFRQRQASYEKVERAAENGDLLRLSYTGTVDDASVEVTPDIEFILKAENTWLPLRAPEILPGAATALVGVKAGEKRQAQIVFGDNFFQKKLAGKSCNYTFDVTEVHAQILPELDEKLAKTMGADSVEELHRIVRQHLERENAQMQNRLVRVQLDSKLCAAASFELPPTILQGEIDARIERKTREYRQEHNDAAPSDEELAKIREDAATEARGALVRHYLLLRIAEAEQVKVTPEEIQAVLPTFAKRFNLSEKETVRRLRDNGGMQDLIMRIREDKTMDLLVKAAEIKKVPASVAAETAG